MNIGYCMVLCIEVNLEQKTDQNEGSRPYCQNTFAKLKTLSIRC